MFSGMLFISRNARWRSEWSVTFPESGGKTELSGVFKIQVHYYEDGNVQLVSSKEVKQSLIITVSISLIFYQGIFD